MATKLFLRNTANNGIGNFLDMGAAAGSASDTGVVNTAASGTEIQWTRTAGGTVLEFISGRAPAGGFTLSGTMTFSIWANESNMNANCGARARVFKRTAAGVESEIGGGPWSDGVEFGTSAAEMTWTGTPTSTAFAEDDRLIVRFYITNIGTMASGHTCTLTYNAADAATGDSFFQINENVAFKADMQSLPAGMGSETDTPFALGRVAIWPTGLAAETDAALPLAALLALNAGLAAEVDSALAPGAALGVGLASESDAALSLAAVMAIPVGMAIEAETPLALAMACAAGLAFETDTGFALVPVTGDDGSPCGFIVVHRRRACC